MKALLLFSLLAHFELAWATGPGVIEEASISNSKSFVVPNEREPHLLYQPNFDAGRRGGVVISVGTLRSFYSAGAQRASELDIIDIDPGVKEFNLLHAAILENASDRFQYVADFFGTELDQALVNQVKEKKLKFSRFVTQTSISAQSTHLSPNLQAFQTLLDRKEARTGQQSLREGFQFHFADQAMHARPNSQLFWLNDEVYSHLRHLALQHKIHSYTGSLTGEQTLNTLAESLRERGERVSIVNLSNVMEWLGTRFEQTRDQKPILQLEKNLKALPLSPEVSFQFTLSRRLLDKIARVHLEAKIWIYGTLNREEFLKKILHAGHLDTPSVYRAYLSSLDPQQKNARSPGDSSLRESFGSFMSILGRCLRE